MCCSPFVCKPRQGRLRSSSISCNASHLAVALLAALPLLAHAAPTDDDATAKTLNTVVVTASKQDRHAFDTAASIDILSGEEVQGRHLDTLGDLAQQVPNLYFTGFTRTNPSLTIRGLGFSDDETDSLSNGVLIDGAPVHAMTLARWFDLEQVEVLRGSQSVLYGQGGMGGVVALRTRDPGEHFGGSLELDLGAYDYRKAQAAVDIPLSERTAVRVAVGHETTDGDTDNLNLQRDDTAGWDSNFGRIKLLHRDMAGGELRLGLHRLRTRGGNDYFTSSALARRHQSQASEAGRNDAGYTLLTGEYTRPLSERLQLTATIGASDSSWEYWMPRSVFGGNSGFHMKNKQHSAEVRLVATDDGWDWMLGAFASHQTRESPYTFDLSPYFLSATTSDVTGDTAALYGELGWKFAPRWRLAGALRVQHDRRRMDWSLRKAGYMDSDGDGIPDTPFEMNPVLRDVKVSDTVPLPRVSVEYRANERSFAWLTLARGYKASGFNLYATSAASAGTPYDPEYGNHVELGYRIRGERETWDVAATAFHTRLRDQQVVIIGSSGQNLTSNAGRSHSRGLELSASLRPLPELTLRAQAGFVEAEFDEYRKGSVDYAGTQFANTPRHSFGASVQWQPTSAWELALTATRQGESTLYPNSSQHNPAYTLVDVHVSFRWSTWSLGIYGNNLTNANYFTRALGNDVFVSGMPRRYGIRLRWEF